MIEFSIWMILAYSYALVGAIAVAAWLILFAANTGDIKGDLAKTHLPVWALNTGICIALFFAWWLIPIMTRGKR